MPSVLTGSNLKDRKRAAAAESLPPCSLRRDQVAQNRRVAPYSTVLALMAHLPDEQNVFLAKARIANKEAEILRVQRVVVGLEDAMARLADDVAAQTLAMERLQHEIAVETAAIAPVRRLPFEVMGEIVCHTTLDPSATLPVLRTLSRVSRAWRHATLNTPRAWTNIRLNCGGPEQGKQPAAVPLQDARDWFRRAGACGKDVTIAGFVVDDRPLALINGFLDLVKGAAPTIRSLHVHFSLSYDMRLSTVHVVTCLQEPIPVLHTLAYVEPSSQPLSQRRSIDLSGMPLLSAWYGELSTCQFPSPVRRQIRHLGIVPYSKIIYNGVTCSTIRAVLDELQKDDVLPHLLTLALPGSAWTVEELQDDDDVPLSADALISLVVVCALELSTIFAYLKTPNLRRLYIRLTDNSMPKRQAAMCLRSLVDRSAPPLQELYLSDISFSDADLLAILQQFPLLETLVMNGAKSSNKVMEALASGHRKNGKSVLGWICPALRRLSVHCPEFKNDRFRITQPAVEAFVAARIEACAAASDTETTQRVSRPLAVRHENWFLTGFEAGAPRDQWCWKDDRVGDQDENLWWSTWGKDVAWVKESLSADSFS